MQNNEEYSKLDYPILNCPLKMPGFTNYDPNYKPAEIKDRKEQIEKIDPENLQYIQVTLGASEEKERIIEQANKIIENT